MNITVREILLLCALLCSSDVIAAVSLIKYDEQPKLFSIVFGEGITNDAVSIILFNTVYHYTSHSEEFTSITPLVITGKFVQLGLYSSLLGLLVAVVASLMFKHMRFLTHSPVHETLLVFSIGFMSYAISEVTKLSGIITLLACGICMSHYTWYNLSP